MADLQALKQQLDDLTLLEAAQLVKMLEEAWGVSAAAPVAVAAAAGAGGAAAAPAEAVEEQTEFDVILKAAQTARDGISLGAPRPELETVRDLAAAESNHAASRKARAALDRAFDRLSAALD